MWKIVGASKDSVLYIYIYIYRLGSPNIDTGMGIGTGNRYEAAIQAIFKKL